MEIIISGKEPNRLGPQIMLSDLEPSQSFQGYINIPNRVRGTSPQNLKENVPNNFKVMSRYRKTYDVFYC